MSMLNLFLDLFLITVVLHIVIQINYYILYSETKLWYNILICIEGFKKTKKYSWIT